MSEWICVCCRKSFRKVAGAGKIFIGICPACDIQLEREAQEMRKRARGMPDETRSRPLASGPS